MASQQRCVTTIRDLPCDGSRGLAGNVRDKVQDLRRDASRSAFPGLGGAERLPPAGVDTSPLAKRRGASATIVRQAVGSDPAGEPALASSSDSGAVGQPSANTKATQPITAVRAALKTILFIFLCFKVFSSGRTRQANLRLSPSIINPQKKRQQLPCRPSGCQLSKNERVLRPVTFYS